MEQGSFASSNSGYVPQGSDNDGYDDDGLPDESYRHGTIFNGLGTAAQQTPEESDSWGEGPADSPPESQAKPRPRRGKSRNRLRFDTEASVYLIPHFHEYPRWDHHAMWYSRNEFLCMVERNYDEQAHEQLLEEQQEAEEGSSPDAAGKEEDTSEDSEQEPPPPSPSQQMAAGAGGDSTARP